MAKNQFLYHFIYLKLDVVDLDILKMTAAISESQGLKDERFTPSNCKDKTA